MIRFFYGIFLGIFSIVSLQGTSEQWHITKTKDLGTLPQKAELRSVTLEKPDKKDSYEEVRIDALLFSASAFHLQLLDSPARDKKLSQVMEGTKLLSKLASADEVPGVDGAQRRSVLSVLDGASTGATPQFAAEVEFRKKFLAGVNGGYFHPDGTPLGLVIIQGKEMHPQEKAKLLSGFVVSTHDMLSLVRVGEKLPVHIEEALQAGPFLVDQGATVPGLERTRVARRTFVATDNHDHWIMGVISPVTLAEASQILIAASPTFFKKNKIERALNLDGGSSSALWVDLKPTPFSQEEFGYVRNFLGLKPVAGRLKIEDGR